MIRPRSIPTRWPPTPRGAKKPPKEPTPKVPANEANVPAAPVGEQIVSIDNDPVWESPTTGQPLDLSYFPSGVRVYVALRPADIWSNEEAKRVLSALGIEASLASG